MLLISEKFPSEFTLFLGSDFHIGTIACYEEGIQKMLDDIKRTKNAFFIGGGDFCETIYVDHPHFQVGVHQADNTPFKQAEYVRKKLKQIDGKIVCLIGGNHELRVFRIFDIIGYLSMNLKGINGKKKLPHVEGRFNGAVKLVVKDHRGNTRFKLYYRHGTKAISSAADDPIRRQANEKLILKRHLKNAFGDCIALFKAHVHKLIVAEPEKSLYLTDDEDSIRQRYTHAGSDDEYIPPDLRWYGSTGGFHKTSLIGASTYAELKEYDPVELGYIKVHVAGKNIVSVEPVIV